MSTIQIQETISRPIGTVFALITDLASYHQWLPASSLYSAVSDVSQSPIQVGTTYVDRGRSSVMQGLVTELVPPTDVMFEQSAHMKMLGFPATLKVRVRYNLQAVGPETQVTRRSTLHIRGPLIVLAPVLLRAIATENKRILSSMKRYLEAR